MELSQESSVAIARLVRVRMGMRDFQASSRWIPMGRGVVFRAKIHHFLRDA